MKKVTLLCLILIAVATAAACSNYNPAITQDSDAYYEDILLDNIAQEDGQLGMGGSHEGCRHDSAFHRFPDLVMNLVGEDIFMSWVDDMEVLNLQSNDPTCPWPYTTFVNFVRHFNITREELQYLMDNSSLYYLRYDFGHNLDVIFSGDDDLIEEFYTLGDLRMQEIQHYNFMWIIKTDLLIYAEENHQAHLSYWISEMNDSDDWQFSPYNAEVFTADIRQWSIPEMIQAFDIPQSFVEDRLSLINNVNRLMFTLDLDAIYNPSLMEELINNAELSVQLDNDGEPLAFDPAEIDQLIIRPL